MIEKDLARGAKNPIEVKQMLEANCSGVERCGYHQDLTQEELDDCRTQLSDVAIELSRLEDEKKRITDEIKAKIKPISGEYGRLLSLIKEKSIFKEEECFKFLYEDQKIIAYYNQEGKLVGQRRARADELQGNIFRFKKEGTND